MPIFQNFVPLITTVRITSGGFPTGVETAAQFSSIIIDQNGIASLAAPGQFTMPQSAPYYIWEFSFWLTTDAVGGAGTYFMRANVKRPSGYIGRTMALYNIDAFQKMIAVKAAPILVAAGAAITFTIEQNSGATRNGVDGMMSAIAIGVSR